MAQQVNPFDIIKTQSSKTPTKSLKPIATDTTSYTNEDTKIDETNIVATEQSNIAEESDSLEATSEALIKNNPFNIRKTDRRVESNSSEILESDPVIISDIEESTTAESSDNSSWFSKLKPRSTAQNNIDYSLNFIFWILIVSLLILAVVINLKRKSFLNLYRAITNDNYLKLLQREEYNGSSFFFLLLYFLFFLNASLFLYQFIISKFEISGYQIFLLIFGGLICVYLTRLISTFILQITFPLEKEAKQFNFTVIMFNIIVGLLLIPVNILTAYTPFGSKMIYVGLGIIVIFYVLRQIRGLFIASRTKGLSYFHFFIYLCTFEVAPIIWIIVILRNWYSVS